MNLRKYGQSSMKLPSINSTNQLLTRLAYLDALRGFAVLYVVVHHVGLMPKPPLPVPDWLEAIVGFGGSGVTLFFIISGFSMCLSWKRHAAAESPVKSFYVSRLARIAPLFFFWLVLSILRDAVFKGVEGQHSAFEIGANVLFLFNLYEPFQQGIVWASWTIGIEMLFYAIFPFIKRAGFDNLVKTSLLLVLLLAVIMMIRDSTASPILPGQSLVQTLFFGLGFFGALPIFIMGVVTYHIHDLLHSENTSRLRLWLGRLLLPLALVALSMLVFYRSTGLIWYYASAVGYAMLLLGFSAWGRNMMVNPLTCYLGKISYSIYLNHPTFVYILIPVYLAIYKLGLGSSVSFSICVILTVSILVPISHLTFRFIETPVMAWGRGQAAQQRSSIHSKFPNSKL
jgi:peptidoglycan/LPS O-acetylase OafA/YrhL